ncbi:MAG: GtrA family protein [Alphaproteobacteria bacterium]|nr:GtrA family protein [Alphaproteobacteria bacterium]
MMGRPLFPEPKTVAQFFRFGLVGGVGFLVDVLMLYLGLFALGLGRIPAGLFSFPFAVTVTWFGNRRFVFPDAAPMAASRQWRRFVFVCALGLVLNRGTYALLVSALPFVYAHPVLGVIGGTAAGMFFNFIAAKKHVFKV